VELKEPVGPHFRDESLIPKHKICHKLDKTLKFVITKIQYMLGNNEDFDRVVMRLLIKVRGEQICWDLWSSKPMTTSINHLHLTFHKNTVHAKHQYISNTQKYP